MQEIAKAAIYVSPFTILAIVLSLRADTNWAAILIGVVVGCIASAFFVALRQTLKTPVQETKAVFRDPPVARPRKQKPRTAQWRDVAGREVGDNAQIEAPRSVAVASARGVVRK